MQANISCQLANGENPINFYESLSGALSQNNLTVIVRDFHQPSWLTSSLAPS